MKLLKPGWVTHDGNPIFSVDVHPDGSRFATGGQGDNSGKVVIWNMAPVRNQKDENNENVPKMLCCMDNHLACVNCVRWSHHGRYLASAGDDKLIMIWQISRYSGPSTQFGSSGTFENVESWRCGSTLRGHSGDVLDLAWCENDQWLASCSIDNTVVVWNALKFPEQIKVLKGHTGLVKGVTWDPVGKYLASQSDDKTLRIWRTSDWQKETVITKPFKECGGTTHVLRLNWSPDGHYLVSAHAMNNRGPTAQIIQRDGWKTDLDFVGHRKAVTAVRFNPRILSKKIKKNASKPELFSCCAVGSRDRSLSIWFTALRRPLVVVHDLFANSILDVSWNQNGHELICCSWDGTIAFFQFSPGELGQTLTREETANIHKKVYGKSLLTMTTGSQQTNASTRIIETAEMLKLQQKNEEKRQQIVTNNATTSNGASNHVTSSVGVVTPSKESSSDTRSKQIETKTPDGRRRITPIFIAPPPRIGEAPLPFSVQNRNSQEPTFQSSTEVSKIIVEKKDSLSSCDAHPLTSQSPKSEIKVRPTEDIKPMIALDRDDIKKAAKSKSETSAEKQKVKEKIFEKVKEKDHEKQDKEKEEAKELKEKEKEKQRKEERDREKEREEKKSKEKVKRRLDQPTEGPPPKLGRPKKDKHEKREERSIAIMPQLEPEVELTPLPVAKSSGLRLPALKIEKSLAFQQDSETLYEVENDITSGLYTLHQLRCKRSNQLVWDLVFSARISALSANHNVVCVVCDDDTLSIISVNGRRLCPKLAIGAAASVLKCCGHYALLVTTNAHVNVWDCRLLKLLIRNENFNEVIGHGKTSKIDNWQLLADSGVPVATMSDGRSYAYNYDLGCWLLVSEKNDTTQTCSDYHQCTPPSGQFKHEGILSSLQSRSSGAGQMANKLFKSKHPLKKASTVSHLESQLATSMALNSKDEYHFWFLTYVKYLVQEGYEDRLRTVCEDLLGPIFKTKSNTWQSAIFGRSKRDILREILPLIGSNLGFQRFFTEFSEQLDAVMP